MSWKKFVAIGDSHGDLVCDKTLKTALTFIKDYKPDLLVHLGDAFDFRALRSGIRASDGEAYEDFVHDTMCGYETLEQLWEAGGSCEKVYLLGNHENRLVHTSVSHPNGIIRSAALDGFEKLKDFTKKHKALMLPYHHDKGVYRKDGVSFVHGYTANNSSVSQHAAHYGEAGGAVVMGHLHRLEHASAPKQGGVEGFSAGCLADFSTMHYAQHRLATSRWCNGWVFGVISKGGHKIWEAKKTGAKWLLPTGIREI